MKLSKLTQKTVFICSLCCTLAATSIYAQTPASVPTNTTVAVTNGTEDTNLNDTGWWSSQPKENKLLYTNVLAASLIGIWGLAEWDYGSADWHDGDEGWFGHDSKYGGADKFGHFWATYAFSDALTGLYKHWGYDSRKASTYAALSAWCVQAFMEMADATSETQGFSYEDMVMNTIGALTSVMMESYPALDDKIDFRVEYVFDVDVNGIFDDYSNHYYSMVLKLEGFDAIENTFLKYLEFHAGFYSRGYDDEDEKDERSLYAGVTLNFSRFFRENDWKKTGKTLEYIQIPYSVLKASHSLDD